MMMSGTEAEGAAGNAWCWYYWETSA